jgi:hypothetical protein
VITIEQLDVRFDAARQRDEIVFAELFARHIARYDEQRKRDDVAEKRADAERSAFDTRRG